MALPSLGMYEVPNALDKAFGGMGQAANTFASMDKKQYIPKKSIGGGMMNALGGGLAGAQVGSMIQGATVGSTMGLPGAAIGAGIGALAYFLSN
jgi:hypothetical protein